MKSGINFIIGFCVGGVIGGFIAYKRLGKKFEERLNTETESIKNAFSNNKQKADKHLIKSEEKSESNQSVNEKNVNPAIFSESEKKDYVNYSNYYKASKDAEVPEEVVVSEQIVEKKEPKKKTKKGPYTISPDEFDTNEDYTSIWLTYYADGVLTDERDNKVDIKSTVGATALNKFGEYEKDVVYVRNDEKKCDYEISRDNRTFKQATGEDEPPEDGEGD